MFFNINWRKTSSIIKNEIVQIMLKYSTNIPKCTFTYNQKLSNAFFTRFNKKDTQTVIDNSYIQVYYFL